MNNNNNNSNNIKIDYNNFLKITGNTENTFLKAPNSRRIKSLESKGYNVIGFKGRGKEIVFFCKKTRELQLKQDLEDFLGVSVKHPEVMNKYIKLWISGSVDISYYSDTKVAELLIKDFEYDLLTLRKYIIRCRKELIQAGFMKPIVRDKRSVDVSKRKFVLKSDIDYSEEFLDTDIALDSWKDLYYGKVKELSSIAKLESKNGKISDETMTTIRQQANQHMRKQLGGSLYTVFKKDFSLDRFK